MPTTNPSISSPPSTRTEPVNDILHGIPVSDPYRWLEDAWSDGTRRWIDDQNAFTQSVLSPLPGREDLEQRLSQLMKVDVVGTPVERGGRYFFSRRRAEEDLYVIVMRESLHGPDIILVDPHPMSADHSTSVQLWDVSDDGRRMLYGVRQGGEDEQEIRLLDVDNQQDLPDNLPRARYFTLSITPDGTGLYYSHHGAAGPRVAFHAIGGPDADRPIFGEGYGPEKIITADLSEDGRTLLLTVSHGAGARKTELYVQDVENGGPIRPIVNDLDARFEGHCIGEELFILSDWDAPRGRIFRVDWGDPDRSHWREVVPEAEGVIDSFSLVGGRLFINELYSVSSRIWIFDTDGANLGQINLPGIGSASGPSGRWLSEVAFLGFTSFAVPWTLYQYNVGDGTRKLWERSEIPLDSSQLEVRQVRYPSKDGTEIPMFLVHRAGLRMDGNRPVLLTGYGGFNASLTPAFSARAAVWAERGGIFAIPNLRGGGEFGEDWHRAGMLEQKQNTFDDFIAAAEWLIREGCTRPEKLAISGGSNGGLLVGAALTQRPDLFRAVVCTYPLLDMVRYHKFLVASFWVPEYGSSDDPEQFCTIYAYSPYHHVEDGSDYPAVLFITGDADTRVDPLHARKMAAMIQARSGSGKPVLLHYDKEAGHSGGRPLGKQIADLTDELAFLFWQLEME